jgi:predicted adenylyl cyclase CyaB
MIFFFGGMVKNIINVEIKAKCSNPSALFDKLKSIGAEYKGEDHQVDTYFETSKGRLKLRQGNIENSLIYYNRGNSKEAKSSEILLEKLDNKTNLRDILRITNGVKVTVDKYRKILFIDNVKFHIDSVPGLGSFMEIEAIDIDRVRNESELRLQCEYYMKELSVSESDLMSTSYSDMLMLDFNAHLHNQAHTFLENLFSNVKMSGLNLDKLFLDHLCYRVSSNLEYKKVKAELQKIGELLIAAEVGGREISTFKLINPISFNGRDVDIIELPSVKAGSCYATGLEHAEFVTDKSFDDLISEYPGVTFDVSAVNKKHNAELRVKFNENLSLKFHHLSLEEVIKKEKLTN